MNMMKQLGVIGLKHGVHAYSKSHFKSVTFVLHVFRSLLKQFSSDFHDISQALVSSLTAPALKISGKNIM